MLKADIPARLPKVWADDAGPSYVRAIPTASQTGITPGAASLADGFPPLTAQPIGAGGIPPDIRDMNGGLQRISQWVQWQNAGGAIGYDSSFATAIGGYPNGAILASTTAGQYWRSTVDNNTVDPDGAGTNWVPAFNGVSLVDGSITNAKLANVPTNTLKGRVAGGTGPVADLTISQATALLAAFIGDSGSGGTKGLVPAPSAGAAAAFQFLSAAGSFANPLTTISNANGVAFKIGGAIIQFGGGANATAGPVSITFPTAFTSLSPQPIAMAFPIINGPNNVDAMSLSANAGTTGCTFNRRNAAGNTNLSFVWFAIGK